MNAKEILRAIKEHKEIKEIDYMKVIAIKKVSGYVRLTRIDNKYSYVTLKNFEMIKKFITMVEPPKLNPLKNFYKNMAIAFDNAVKEGLSSEEINSGFYDAVYLLHNQNYVL